MHSCGMGDFLGYNGDTGNRRIPLNWVHNSDGFQVKNKFYSVVCRVTSTEFAVGLSAAGWSGIRRYP